MLTEICQILRNWFDRDRDKWHGKFTISGGNITFTPDMPSEPFSLQTNQYFRIIGSLFNDGVHKFQAEDDPLVDESFEGSVWSMGIPPAVIELAKEIEDWQTKYGDAMLSPYTSESFGGYTYSKGASASGGGGTTGLGWQDAFRTRLNQWRKI